MTLSRGPVICQQVTATELPSFPVKENYVNSSLKPMDVACVEALSLALDQVTSCGNCCTLKVP